MKKKTRIFYREDAKMLRKMQAEDVKRLVLAYLDYEVGEPIEKYFQDGDNLQFVFMKMAECIDVNETRYNETVEKRREAGKKGGEAKAAKMRSKIDTSTGEVFVPTDQAYTSDLTVGPILEEEQSGNLNDYILGHKDGMMRHNTFSSFVQEFPDAERLQQLENITLLSANTMYQDLRKKEFQN